MCLDSGAESSVPGARLTCWLACLSTPACLPFSASSPSTRLRLGSGVTGLHRPCGHRAEGGQCGPRRPCVCSEAGPSALAPSRAGARPAQLLFSAKGTIVPCLPGLAQCVSRGIQPWPRESSLDQGPPAQQPRNWAAGAGRDGASWRAESTGRVAPSRPWGIRQSLVSGSANRALLSASTEGEEPGAAGSAGCGCVAPVD